MDNQEILKRVQSSSYDEREKLLNIKIFQYAGFVLFVLMIIFALILGITQKSCSWEMVMSIFVCLGSSYAITLSIGDLYYLDNKKRIFPICIFAIMFVYFLIKFLIALW